MNLPLTVILTVFVFGALILIHELGHYICARIFGVAIHEFSIGMGPKLFHRVSPKTGIEYSLRLLPVGGYVAMVGEDGESDEDGAMSSKPKWQRAIVLAAGSVMNFLMGFAIMVAYVLCSPALGSTVVAEFDEGAASYEAGLRVNDKVIAIHDRAVHIPYELSYAISYYGAEPVDITVLRDGEKKVIEDIVFSTVTESGITMGTQDFRVFAVEKNFKNICVHAFYQSVSTVRVVWDSLIDLVTGKYGFEAVSGPVGVSTAIGESASYGLSSFLMIFGLIAVNLGVMNLLPFPALDGGRLLFLAIEAIRRKPIKPEIEGFINFAGLALLFGLMIVVTFKDIWGLF